MTREKLFEKLRATVIVHLEDCKDISSKDEYLDEDIEIAQKCKTFKGLFRAIPGWDRHSAMRLLVSSILENDVLAEEICNIIDDTW